MSFLVGGGDDSEHVGVRLMVDGQAVLRASGNNVEALKRVFWDLEGPRRHDRGLRRQHLGLGPRLPRRALDAGDVSPLTTPPARRRSLTARMPTFAPSLDALRASVFADLAPPPWPRASRRASRRRRCTSATPGAPPPSTRPPCPRGGATTAHTSTPPSAASPTPRGARRRFFRAPSEALKDIRRTTCSPRRRHARPPLRPARVRRAGRESCSRRSGRCRWASCGRRGDSGGGPLHRRAGSVRPRRGNGVEAALTPRTRALSFATPDSDPCGTALGPDARCARLVASPGARDLGLPPTRCTATWCTKAVSSPPPSTTPTGA